MTPDPSDALPDELSTYAWLLARSGHLTRTAMVAEVAEAAAQDHGRDDAAALAPELVDQALDRVRREQAEWPVPTDHDRLEAAFAELRADDVLVLTSIEDHWTAAAELDRCSRAGRPAAGVVWCTAPDVWHAVQHAMLELNLWHADGANAAPGDELLDLVLGVLHRHGLDAHFDEGRVETACSWQRRVT